MTTEPSPTSSPPSRPILPAIAGAAAVLVIVAVAKSLLAPSPAPHASAPTDVFVAKPAAHEPVPTAPPARPSEGDPFPPSAPVTPVKVAILTFKNVGKDKALAKLVADLPAAAMKALSSTPNVNATLSQVESVMSENAVYATNPELAGFDVVVEGAFERQGDAVRATTNLYGASGARLLGFNSKRSLRELPALMAEVSNGVAEVITPIATSRLPRPQ